MTRFDKEARYSGRRSDEWDWDPSSRRHDYDDDLLKYTGADGSSGSAGNAGSNGTDGAPAGEAGQAGCGKVKEGFHGSGLQWFEVTNRPG